MIRLSVDVRVKREDLYVLVTHPNSQRLMDTDFFDECIGATGDYDLDNSYFVPIELYEKHHDFINGIEK